jgi:hypothetical protein
MEKTIAFSNGKNVWTTRYSFVSACMGWIRSFMVSSPKTSNDSKLFWRHDESSEDNNKFYDVQAASTIAVTFNDNPSANKQFKAFSIESSDPASVSGLNTFVVNKGGGNYTPKETMIGKVKEKGGIIYGHIGEEGRITMSNISYIGVVKSVVGFYQDSDELPLTEAEALSDGNTLTGYKYVKLESVDAIPNTTGNFSILTQNQLQTFKENGSGSAATPPNNVPFYYNGGFITQGTGFTIQQGDAIFIGYTQNNGEAPKGQYADAVVSLGSDDFEVYALNVEYSPTNLDHNN